MKESGAESPVLLFLTNDFGGGTANHFLEMMKHWDLDRWRPEIVAGQERTARVRSPVPVTQLPPEKLSFYPVAQALQLRRVAGLIRSRAPAVVHTYFFWPIVYARLLKLIGVIPRLVENREDTGFGWGWHEYAWLRSTRSVPDKVICVSEAVRSTVIEREGMEPNRTTVIRNGVPPAPAVDPDRVSALRRRLDVPPEAPVVGMVANLNREVKGGDRFLRVATRVLEEVPEAVFLLVGLAGLDDRLQEEARRAGVASSLRFTGYTEDVARHYELMDVSILTSSTEGLSITLLESMSHALPVVATRVGGNPEVVTQGETGWLVPLQDVDAFAGRVTDLLRDPDLRARMGEAGRRRARAEFAVADVAGRYEALYREILSERHTSSPGSAAGPVGNVEGLPR